VVVVIAAVVVVAIAVIMVVIVFLLFWKGRKACFKLRCHVSYRVCSWSRYEGWNRWLLLLSAGQSLQSLLKMLLGLGGILLHLDMMQKRLLLER